MAAQIVAFLAIVLLVGVAIGFGTALLTGAIRHVPVVGGLNRLGGLLAGVALGLLGVWLLTICLLLLPTSVAPFVAGVHHSKTAQLVRSLTPQWSRSSGAHAHLEPDVPTHVGGNGSGRPRMPRNRSRSPRTWGWIGEHRIGGLLL